MEFAHREDWCDDARSDNHKDQPGRPMPWFRTYRADLNNRKLQELPLALFRTAINLRSIVSHIEGELPELSEIAYALRFKTSKQAQEHVEKLIEAGIIERRGNALHISDWKQCASDDERRNKENQRLNKKSPRTRPRLVFSQREKKTEIQIQSALSRYREREDARSLESAGKTKMTDDRMPTEVSYSDAAYHGLSPAMCDAEFDRFRDHYLATGEMRADWVAAFRSWLAKRDRFAGKWGP